MKERRRERRVRCDTEKRGGAVLAHGGGMGGRDVSLLPRRTATAVSEVRHSAEADPVQRQIQCRGRSSAEADGQHAVFCC